MDTLNSINETSRFPSLPLHLCFSDGVGIFYAIVIYFSYHNVMPSMECTCAKNRNREFANSNCVYFSPKTFDILSGSTGGKAPDSFLVTIKAMIFTAKKNKEYTEESTVYMNLTQRKSILVVEGDNLLISLYAPPDENFWLKQLEFEVSFLQPQEKKKIRNPLDCKRLAKLLKKSFLKQASFQIYVC